MPELLNNIPEFRNCNAYKQLEKAIICSISYGSETEDIVDAAWVLLSAERECLRYAAMMFHEKVCDGKLTDVTTCEHTVCRRARHAFN
jgi:hypothetical protein